MRQFGADYLEETRRGLWADRGALDPLDLVSRVRVLDVGCGAGNLTAVLREEVPEAADVVGLDADADLLAAVPPPTVRGDATRLPLADDSVDLVVCQALLVNLPDPLAAVREFARVAADAVAAIEPDNGAVSVSSTVAAEPALARQAREAYIAGAPTDVTLGGDAAALFERAGLRVTGRRVRHHARRTEPPYDDADLEATRRKVRATRLAATRETLLSGDLDEAGYEALARDWRSMGRTAAEQMADGEYRRREVVPFHVTVGEL